MKHGKIRVININMVAIKRLCAANNGDMCEEEAIECDNCPLDKPEVGDLVLLRVV